MGYAEQYSLNENFCLTDFSISYKNQNFKTSRPIARPFPVVRWEKEKYQKISTKNVTRPRVAFIEIRKSDFLDPL